MRQILRALSILIVLSPILIGIVFPGMALAHERRKVGKYELVVGFLAEPALVGQPNGISLAVTNTETNQPVEGLQQTLQAEITYGDKAMPVSLRARFRVPGNYTADFIPTRAGSYGFRFYGEIEGMRVDERFKSGPGTFNDVQGLEELQFPDKTPDASEIAARSQRAQDAGSLGVLVGSGAAVLAVAGIVLGLVSFRARRS